MKLLVNKYIIVQKLFLKSREYGDGNLFILFYFFCKQKCYFYKQIQMGDTFPQHNVKFHILRNDMIVQTIFFCNT